LLRRNCLLTHVIEGNIEGGREDEEENVNSYWMTPRNREVTGN
jgi:hypothetical protein